MSEDLNFIVDAVLDVEDPGEHRPRTIDALEAEIRRAFGIPREIFDRQRITEPRRPPTCGRRLYIPLPVPVDVRWVPTVEIVAAQPMRVRVVECELSLGHERPPLQSPCYADGRWF